MDSSSPIKTTSSIDFLVNKKVLIFDTETTGLPLRRPNAKFGSRDEYYEYFNNDAYDSARIVSIAWYYVSNFTADMLSIDKSAIQHYIRKPDTFTEIPTTYIHGITYETALLTGSPFNEIIDSTEFGTALLECDYIVAHNINFDIHVLLNEIHRLQQPNENKYSNHIVKIKTMLDTNQCICTGEIGKPICKLEYKNKFPAKKANANIKINANAKTQTNYKMPKLIEFYSHMFNREFNDAHSANGDVLALIEILKAIIVQTI